MADPAALEYFARQREKTASTSTVSGSTATDRVINTHVSTLAKRPYPGLFPSMFPIYGSPDDVAEQFVRLSAGGLDGSTLVFLNYLEELPFFIEEVLPRLERLGLRRPASSAAAVV
jgi:alkanesulfonate monooxygenase SsuD/methylene tetrahydromethanopterin reductase-like flavin-dependent oxidoreductase (luciferase family)